MKQGCKFGTHRVIYPKGVLPQTAIQIDNDMEIYENEILIDVETLNIDSASFRQIREQASDDDDKIAEIIIDIVKDRGKLQNPVTGSGGMLIGTVEKIGEAITGKVDINVGDKIATLVSLSLTPLRIDEVLNVRKDMDQVDIKGKAILFESGIYSKLPEDMPRSLALAALDVAGAPAQTLKLVKPGDKVMILGAGGKSGALCSYAAKKAAGPNGRVIGFVRPGKSAERLKKSNLCDMVVEGDAKSPVDVLNKVIEANDGEFVDVAINVVNISETEMSTILPVKDDGVVYFFSMATSFTRAALGAEGIGKDVTMIIGNGYTKGHCEITLEIIRESKVLRDIFTEIYVQE